MVALGVVAGKEAQKKRPKLIEHIKTHNKKSRCRNPSNTYTYETPEILRSIFSTGSCLQSDNGVSTSNKGTLCRGWGGLLEKPLTSLNRQSPTAATHIRFFFFSFYFLFRLLFAKNLKIPLENPCVLWFPRSYSDYSFGQLLLFGKCDLFRF